MRSELEYTTEKKITLSFGNSYLDNLPHNQDITLAQLAMRWAEPDARGDLSLEGYLNADPQTQKKTKDGRYFIPARMNGGRSASDVEELTGFALDFDDSHWIWKDIANALSKWTYLAYTSFSHSRIKPKYRVFIPYANPISPSQHLPVYDYFLDLFKGHIDKRSATTNQLWYEPACPYDASDLYQFVNHAGQLFNPLSVPQVSKHKKKQQESQPGEPIAQGDRESTLMRTAGAMRRHGCTADEIYVALAAINDRCTPALSEAELRRLSKSASKYRPVEDIPPVSAYADNVIPFRAKQPRLEEIPRDLIESAPGVIADYVEWYLMTARYPEPVYALISALTWIACHAGKYKHLSDCYLNHYLLGSGPTESGKQYILVCCERALANSTKSAIGSLETYFASGSAIWWTLSTQTNGVVWFETEIGKFLTSATQPGTHSYEVVRTLLGIHDSVLRPTVNPYRYSQRSKDANTMPQLSHPFLGVVGLTTPTIYSDTRSISAEDGSLNRFLILNCEGTAVESEHENYRPKTEALQRFCDMTTPVEKQLTYAPGVERYRTDWNTALKDTRRAAPGVWGRLALKASRMALTAAVACRSDTITKEHMQWAMDVVETSAKITERKFAEHGGLSRSKSNALELAIMSAVERAEEKGKVASRKYLAQCCNRYKEASKREREDAISGLEADGKLVVANAALTIAR